MNLQDTTDSFENDWRRDSLYKIFGKNTNNKPAETYILNRLWFKLVEELNKNGLEPPEPVTQQLVFYNGKHYFIDLYFPALRIAVECDEKHHMWQKPNDVKRQNDIESVIDEMSLEEALFDGRLTLAENTPIAVVQLASTLENESNSYSKTRVYRIKAYKKLGVIEAQIDSIVRVICQSMTKDLSWRNLEDKLKDIENQKCLKVSDSYDFASNVQVCNLFGCNFPEGTRKNYFVKLNTAGYNCHIWIPNLVKFDGTSGTKSGWKNSFGSDFSITESHDSIVEEIDEADLRITFVKGKNSLGQSIRRFAGLYRLKCRSIGENKDERVWERIATEIHWAFEGDQIKINFSEMLNK